MTSSTTKLFAAILFGAINVLGDKGPYIDTPPQPETTCYNTMDKNPCTYKNRKAGKFYFPSCNSECNFIQCDDFGTAFERPCAPGTSWDPVAYTCNHDTFGKCPAYGEYYQEQPQEYYPKKETTTTEKPYVPPKYPAYKEDTTTTTQEPYKPTPKYKEETTTTTTQEPYKPPPKYPAETTTTTEKPYVPPKYPVETTTTTTKKPYTPPYTPPDMHCYDTEYNSPCTAANRYAKNFHFRSCNSCCKFIQCDNFGNAFERPCAPGTMWDQKALTCVHNNGQCSDMCMEEPKYEPEPPKYYPDTTTTTTTTTKAPYTPPKYPEEPPKYPEEPMMKKCFDTEYNSPCTYKNILANKFYWPSCNECNYIQCDESGKAFERPCAPGTIWDQKLQTCNHDYLNKCPIVEEYYKEEPQTAYHQEPEVPEYQPEVPEYKPVPELDMCYDTKYNNPCGNKLFKDYGLFYFPSCSSCCNFIQCDEYGQAFDMPCAEGTYWDQDVLTCNHNYGQCADEQCKRKSTTPKPYGYQPEPEY